MTYTQYSPGVCNIGSAEIALRRMYGWGGLAATALCVAVLAILRSPVPWWAGLVIPATVSACGFLQAELRFCFAFGLRHVFNFSGTVGRVERVADREQRAADRGRSLLIIALSLACGVVVTAAAIFIRSFL